MADISKCMDFLCPSKEKCYRFTAPVSQWQSYGGFANITVGPRVSPADSLNKCRN